VPQFVTAVVTEVVEEHLRLQRLRVDVGGEARLAILYTRFAAPALAGDRVILNTTASDLDLGSGGEDFVVWNLARETYDAREPGHIMKLRYTPMQSEIVAVEAPESPHHKTMSKAKSLDGMPVLAASLHSQLLPVVVALKEKQPNVRIAYVMTDGGALEASLSDTVRRLREMRWLSVVITVGHAIGGDLEAVNVYSGLLAARHVAQADVAVVGMGPGVVGTATAFGTSALELGMTLNAASSLHGRPIAVVRMSSAEERGRHAGISHHAVTALMSVALVSAEVPVPKGHKAGLQEVAKRHTIFEVKSDEIIRELSEARGLGLEASHMGRGPEDDRLFFLAAGAAGFHAADRLKEG
jgi:hypothetical protein